jgi:hypothetical protein
MAMDIIQAIVLSTSLIISSSGNNSHIYVRLIIVLLDLQALESIESLSSTCQRRVTRSYLHVFPVVQTAYSEDLWYGAIKTLAVFWELQATMWHGTNSRTCRTLNVPR